MAGEINSRVPGAAPNPKWGALEAAPLLSAGYGVSAPSCVTGVLRPMAGRGFARRFSMLALALSVENVECADPASAPNVTRPAFKQLRYDEDYSYLRNPDQRVELLDKIKYIPLNEGRDWYLTLGGEVRLRYEYFHNAQWGAGPQDDNGYLLQRYMFHSDAHFGEFLRLFTQLKSGLVEDRDGGPRPTDKDELDLHQAFVDGRVPWGDKNSVTLRAGRQELNYGSSRLISFRESPNVRQSFDGLKIISKTANSQLDAFVTRPVRTDPGIFDDEWDLNQKLWGLYGVAPLSFLPGASMDLYYLGTERDRARFDQGTARELRHTVGTRIWGRKARWDYNFEFVYQFGTFGDGDIRAWTAASDTGYTFQDVSLKPRLFLKANITSGDRDPNDPDLETFNPLFPRGGYFSETSLIGPANHIDLHPGIQLQVTDRLTWTSDWDFFWRQSDRDGIYGNAVNLVRSGRSTEAHYIGSQIQTMVEWRWNRHLTLTAAYAHFFPDEFLEESGPSKDVDYASAWVTWKF